MGFLARYAEQLYAVLRIVSGFMFALHGAQKVFGVLGGTKATAPLYMAAGWIELVGGILIAVGAFTPIVAFICSGEMAAAYFIAHFPQGFWPVENKGELPALYCFLFLYMAARGSGVWSVDAARRPGSRHR
jgi:putative oxidoreductase